MELSFGRRYADGKVLSTVRVKSDTPTDFRGQVRIETNRVGMVITDTFEVIEKFQTKTDSEGNVYDWYFIKDHYQTQERFTPTRQEAMDTALEKQRGDIDYIAMMSDIELDTEV